MDWVVASESLRSLISTLTLEWQEVCSIIYYAFINMVEITIIIITIRVCMIPTNSNQLFFEE